MSDRQTRIGAWIVYDPLDDDHRTFSTEDAAVRYAEDLIGTYIDDGAWAEEVTGIFVAQRTHVIERQVIANRSEMGCEAFDDMTGDCNDNEEWWAHTLVPDQASDDPPASGGDL